MFIALVLIIIGVLFFARAANLISPDMINVLWPLILIIIGLGLLSHKTFGHRCNDKDCWRCKEVALTDKKKRK